MKTLRLGRSGLQVSRIALGMMTYGRPDWRPWVLDEAASRSLVKRAVELGINFFDTADMYSSGESEVLTGRFVREFCRRDEVVIASKAYYLVEMEYRNAATAFDKAPPNLHGLSRKRLFHAVDASLARLKTDYIDLYQIHRFDPNTPVEETMEALHDLVKAGKLRYLGASSMWAWQFAKMQETARRHGWTPFISMQNHYNLAYREEEREMIPLCRDQGVGLIPWSPLARGFLAGNRSRDDKAGGATSRAQTDNIAQNLYYRDSDFKTVDRLKALAVQRGVSPATLAYAWLLHQPGVTAPIIGASKLPQLDEAVAAAELSLSADELQALGEGYEPHPIAGHS
ncbi:aldo/keto reductase [Rhizobacter sp. OV335]|uniref:aldo/keto reductase n=1 Tax=Rhizobacter sp. OV335 TaxID=1500264 RepID=UPI00091BEE7E|nr:aldo/keto reductase [Rhizobacter sp. OV335]SHN17118.1 aryl-alcohol dehydrogenase (NADP+) [Rhizobacter sp. OV335]